MAKRYSKFALVYAIIAMAFGVFYREFTKLSGFTGATRLSTLHTHYFVLGMLFFLVLVALEKLFAFSNQKTVKPFLVLHTVGLNCMAISFLIRGIYEVREIEIAGFIKGFLVGFGGIAHIALGVGIILFFVALMKSIKDERA